MQMSLIGVAVGAGVLLIGLLVLGVFVALMVYAILALRKYLRSAPGRKRQAAIKKELGQVIKEYREQRRMTQEFVAEHLGVSRQAVSKWENGSADPSTANLLGLAKLFGVSAQELLEQVEAKG